MLSTIPCYQNRPIEVKDEAYKFNLLKSMYQFVPDSLLLQIRENLNDLPVCLEPPGTFSTLQLCAEICRYLHFHILHQPPVTFSIFLGLFSHFQRQSGNFSIFLGFAATIQGPPWTTRNLQWHPAPLNVFHQPSGPSRCCQEQSATYSNHQWTSSSSMVFKLHSATIRALHLPFGPTSYCQDLSASSSNYQNPQTNLQDLPVPARPYQPHPATISVLHLPSGPSSNHQWP